MSKNNEIATALGKFLITCGKLDTNVWGGKQKLQRIVGEHIFYKKHKGWWYNTNHLLTLSVTELNELTEKVEKNIK